MLVQMLAFLGTSSTVHTKEHWSQGMGLSRATNICGKVFARFSTVQECAVSTCSGAVTDMMPVDILRTSGPVQAKVFALAAGFGLRFAFRAHVPARALTVEVLHFFLINMHRRRI